MADANERLAGKAAIVTNAGSHGNGRAVAMPVRRGADAAH
jgi:hypothetical protein